MCVRRDVYSRGYQRSKGGKIKPMTCTDQFRGLLFSFVGFTTIGTSAAVAYLLGATLSLPVSIILIFLCSSAIFYFWITNVVGMISLILAFCTALPFVHLVPFLFFNWSYVPSAMWAPGDPTIWGLATVPYMFDRATIRLTAELGAVGCCGLLAGILANYSFCEQRLLQVRVSPKTWNLVAYFIFLGLSIAASKLAAPALTIFSANYTGTGGAAESMNFGSAGLASYILLQFCLADVIFESQQGLRLLKLAGWIAALLFIVVWLQFAHGDRECIPMVLASAVVFWKWGAPIFAASSMGRIAIRCVTTVAFLLVLLSGFALQTVRYNMAGKSLDSLASVTLKTLSAEDPLGTTLTDDTPKVVRDIDEGSREPGADRGWWFDELDRRIPAGTWSAVLLTPLSIAGDEVRGLLHWRWGRTYVDMVASLPPGFLADLLGYRRPIDANNGPAHEMRYGEGGTHVVVVPFMNFGLFGVVAILGIWGGIGAYVERWSVSPGGKYAVEKVAVFGSVLTVIPQWIWYGDKIAITGAIISLTCLAIHFLTSIRVQTKSLR